MGLRAFLNETPIGEIRWKYAASPRFRNQEGKPEQWELRCLTGAEDEALRMACVRRVPVPGRRGIFMSEPDPDLYLGKLAAACTVYPDLRDRELQDSYRVMGEDALLKAMLTAGEYAAYLEKAQEICGFGLESQEVDEAKN